MIKNQFSRFLRDESGAAMIEYALLIGLIGLAVLGSASKLGDMNRATLSHSLLIISNVIDGK